MLGAFPWPSREEQMKDERKTLKRMAKTRNNFYKQLGEIEEEMDTELLPKNHLQVQVLKEMSASQRMGLRGRLRDHRDEMERCTAHIEASYVQRAIDDLENRNYRSLYLERYSRFLDK